MTVYCIECEKCNKLYIGHKTAAQTWKEPNGPKSIPRTRKPQIQFQQLKIIATGQNKHKRLTVRDMIFEHLVTFIGIIYG